MRRPTAHTCAACTSSIAGSTVTTVTRSRHASSFFMPWNWTRSSPRRTPCWHVPTSNPRCSEIGDVTQQKSLASDALDKALKLDPAIRDWWWVKLMFDDNNAAPWTVYASHLEQAIATNPTDSEPMLWLAYTYLLLARRDEALQMFERAYAADPLSPIAIGTSMVRIRITRRSSTPARSHRRDGAYVAERPESQLDSLQPGAH